MTILITDIKTNNIFRYNLNKPVTIKPFNDYKIEFNGCNCETWYGSGGKATVSGEKNIEFLFKSGGYDSGLTQGNFPELYYYA
jgi:hypothetical protein